jgi:secreted PhoX family phosphatase
MIQMTRKPSFRRTAMAVAMSASFYAAGASAAPPAGSQEASPQPEKLRNVQFSTLSAPATDSEKREVRTSDLAVVDGRPKKIGYTTILRSGEQRGESAADNTFGQLVDNTGKPILSADGSTMIADSNDFSSILTVGKSLFSVNHFESLPGAFYLTALAQDPITGKLSATKTQAIDMSSVEGVWNPCAGSVTPWGTHLGSEEYEPDAKNGKASANAMARYFGGGTTVGGDASRVNPYFWGFPVEIAVTDEDGSHTVAKHYSMGRFAHELSYVMPDQRTVYEADDGTNVALYMYVADAAGKLDSGSLYAAKWNQISPPGASEIPAAKLSWIKLGHASDAEVRALIDAGTTFADIFDSAAPNSDFSCPEGYRSVNANGVGEECLALKPGMEQAAAFLETRRYAGYQGATTELRKEEGMSFDPESKTFYIAYSEVQYGMEDNAKNGVATTSYDRGTSNDVKALFNSCGAVYGFRTGRDRKIGSEYVLKATAGGIAGVMTTLADPSRINPTTVTAYASDSPYAGSTCAIDSLANPDNVSYMPGQNTLLIGEDSTSGHQNDMVWAWNTRSDKLTRIESTPYGAETTSVYYYPQIGNFGYIMSVVQHPYGESDGDKVSADSAERHSYFGFVGPLPAVRQ